MASRRPFQQLSPLALTSESRGALHVAKQRGYHVDLMFYREKSAATGAIARECPIL